MLEQLADYKILDRIGAGGMGEVYRARDTRLGRTVAVKVLPQDVADDPDRRERFVREARACAALSNPNIAALFEIGEADGRLFLVFEFVPGQTLTKKIDGRAMNPRQAIHLAIQMADALGGAHALGIVHRDLKPDNIIVTPKGRAKILDFGLAQWTAGGADRERAPTMVQTAVGVALGTAAYMSPEQALGQAVDHRTDIFSLGIVLHEMLTGSRPFHGATAAAVTLQIVEADPPPPSAVNPIAPRELDPIVARMLSKPVAGRYQSAATLAAELRAVDAILDRRSEAAERASALSSAAKPRRAVGRWMVVGGLLLGAAAASWQSRAPIQRVWRHTFGPSPSPVIAVVPFETDAGRTSFADGLAEDLITRLGQTPGVKVVGRSATRTFRGRPPGDVAKETGAAVILSGSVRPSADAFTMSLELVDPVDGTTLWSRRYTRDLKDIFAVQSEVADAVAAALKVTLRPTASSIRAASRTVDPKAYDVYLRGREALAQQRNDSLQLFEEATAIDPGLAEAFAGLAETIEVDTIVGGLPLDATRRQRQKTAAERAYQLDPDLPQANLAMGVSASSLRDALGYLRRAVERDPSYGEGLHQIGDQIVDFDPALAIDFYRASLKADSGLDVGHTDIALALAALNRAPEGHAEVDQMRREPVPGWRDGVHTLLDLDQGRVNQAIERLNHSPLAGPIRAVLTVRTLATANRFREALASNQRRPLPLDVPCAARSTIAAVRREVGDPRLARDDLNRALVSTRGPAPDPNAMRCAVYAAAAMNDAKAAGPLLERIAGREDWLRYWALPIATDRGGLVLRGRVFPWNRIVDTPPMIAARAALDAAYARERDITRSVLAGLLQ